MKPSATRVFWAWKEKWSMEQFSSKGDQWHKARLAAKYGCLQYAGIDKDNKIGTLSHDCHVLYKIQDKR